MSNGSIHGEMSFTICIMMLDIGICSQGRIIKLIENKVLFNSVV